MSTTEMATLGGRCRVFRHLRGLTLSEAAQASGLNLSTVWRIETDRVNPALLTLIDLAKAYHVPIGVLTGAETFDPEEDTWTK